MKTYRLTSWELAGFWPYHPLLKSSVETKQDLKGVTPWIPVQVPGGVYDALLAAGWIEDPRFGLNSLKCEWVANRWWIYKTQFTLPPAAAGVRRTLCLEGLDYEADILLNDRTIAHHKGMYLPVRIDVTELLREGENVLMVMFYAPPEEMGQIGYTSRTRTQKARFGYKWDFSSRLVNIGLYREVTLIERETAELSDVHLVQEDPRRGRVRLEGRVCAFADGAERLSVHCSRDGRTVCGETQPLALPAGGARSFSVTLTIPDPALWYPNGHGAQPLYTFAVAVYNDAGAECDRFAITTGLREVAYRPNAGSPADALPYTLVINGEPVYIKGVNVVPLDMEYGTVTEERYDRLLRQLRDANVNLVRIWGGGLIENEELYRLCDHYGLMVWQEFIQSSSGLDNIPSEDPGFLLLLERVARTAVKRIRSHGCHVYWCGGNELQQSGNRPIDATDPGSRMLAQIVAEEDPGKLFLPTSAFGPREFLDVGAAGTNYDVHGPWKYEGVRREYEIFNRSDSLLHSEFGCDGLGNAATIRKYLPEEEWEKLDGTSPVWRHHGEWWNTWERDGAIFGAAQNLDDYETASQFIQASALQYAIEANRSRAFRNSGTILWQANEPWPQVSGTNLIDYDGLPKLAYFLVRDAYRPVHLSMRHEALVYAPGEVLRGVVRVHNDTAVPVTGDVTVTLLAGGVPLLTRRMEGCTADRPCRELAELAVTVPDGVQAIEVILELDTGEAPLQNRYLLPVCRPDGLCSLDAVKTYISAVKSRC